MTISATDIVVPVCSKIPLLYLLTQKVAQKFGYVLGIKKMATGNNSVAIFLSYFSGKISASFFAMRSASTVVYTTLPSGLMRYMVGSQEIL